MILGRLLPRPRGKASGAAREKANLLNTGTVMPKSLLAPPSLSQALLPVFLFFFFSFSGAKVLVNLRAPD